MHTDTSLKIFGGVTKEAGRLLRHFSNTVCKNFDTEETPTETAARVRREEREFAKAKEAGKTPPGKVKKRSKTKKKFNLATYKLHALGDYPWTIWRFGPTDLYSTQRVSIFFDMFSLLIALSGRDRTSTGETSLRTDKQASICRTNCHS